MRRLYWCQELAEAGDNPYMPEFVFPDDPSRWREVTIPGHWFVYLIYAPRVRNPLYVGYTNNIHRRLTQHRQTQAWWPLVDRITVDACPTRREALDTESSFIRQLAPLFNIAGNRHG